jgi:CcmD family protein
MENLNYLLATFLIIWAVLFIYIAILSHKQRRLKHEIDILKTSQHQTKGKDKDE